MIVYRAEKDIFRLSPFTDLFVHPTNLLGSCSLGLSLAFRNRYPKEMYEDFRNHCQGGKARVGRLHIWQGDGEYKSILHCFTKNHFADTTTRKELEKCLNSIREHLLSYPTHDLVMPLLGRIDADLEPICRTMHFEAFSDLPNIVHISMLPDAYETPPLYLSITGSRDLEDKAWIADRVDEALSDWKMKVSDFRGIITGDAQGVDAVVARDTEDRTSLVTDLFLPGIPFQAKWKTLGKAAGMLRNRTLADVGHRFIILFKSKAKPSPGSKNMADLVSDKPHHVFYRGP